MDAGIVLSTSPPVTTATDLAPDAANEDAAAFEQHLAAETAPPKPPTQPRKPPHTASDAAPEQAPANDAEPLPSYSLSQPTAPVIVRTDGAPAIVDFALTPSGDAPLKVAAATPDIAAPVLAPAPPPPAPVAAQPAANPAAPAPTPAPAPVAPAEPAPVAADAALPAAQPVTDPALQVAALAAAKTPAAPVEPLRASGRGRAATAEDAAQPATPAKSAQTSATPAAQAARPETAQAVAPATPAAQTRTETGAAPQAIAEAAAAPAEARHAAATVAHSAVHRPPSVAQTMAQQVIRRFEGQSTSIEVRLDPAELGRVQVKLEVGADSRVTAVVAAENPATLSDLMRSARELERALESAGLELASGGLSFDLASRGETFGDQGGDGRSASGGGDAAAEASAPAQTASRPFGLETWRGVRVDVTV